VCLKTLSLLLGTQLASAFYMPGLLPKDYQVGDELTIKVSDITSQKIHGHEYDFYETNMCMPDDFDPAKKSFGEALAGELWSPSPYKVNIGRQ